MCSCSSNPAPPSTSTTSSSGPSTAATTGTASGSTASADASSCSSGPVVVNVNETVTQTISGAPAPYEAWNNTYSWKAIYQIQIDRTNRTVKVLMKLKVSGTITEDQKAGWKSALETKWNNKAKIRCVSGTTTTVYPVSFDVSYVSSGEHYVVTANSADATEGGRSGLGGTTSMLGWGVADTVDIGHEFGHMLGCVDEYFTCNGVNYSSGSDAFRSPTGGIMNNPANNPKLTNYTFIKNKVEGALGSEVTCTVIAP